MSAQQSLQKDNFSLLKFLVQVPSLSAIWLVFSSCEWQNFHAPLHVFPMRFIILLTILSTRDQVGISDREATSYDLKFMSKATDNYYYWIMKQKKILPTLPKTVSDNKW